MRPFSILASALLAATSLAAVLPIPTPSRNPSDCTAPPDDQKCFCAGYSLCCARGGQSELDCRVFDESSVLSMRLPGYSLGRATASSSALGICVKIEWHLIHRQDHLHYQATRCRGKVAIRAQVSSYERPISRRATLGMTRAGWYETRGGL
ncbi:hypothetical protein F4810DRAFT_710025 [Camillea tinctor]|nr:hypothetical protein F4810DRAFT_710025 [Camillea tinctor]